MTEQIHRNVIEIGILNLSTHLPNYFNVLRVIRQYYFFVLMCFIYLTNGNCFKLEPPISHLKYLQVFYGELILICKADSSIALHSFISAFEGLIAASSSLTGISRRILE